MHASKELLSKRRHGGRGALQTAVLELRQVATGLRCLQIRCHEQIAAVRSHGVQLLETGVEVLAVAQARDQHVSRSQGIRQHNHGY